MKKNILINYKKEECHCERSVAISSGTASEIPRSDRAFLIFNKTLLSVISVLIVSQAAVAAPVWEISPDKANIVNPVPVSEKSLMRGEGAYKQLCATCHGNDGHGNKFSVSYWAGGMPDIKKSMEGQSDGALYYKISEGREAMPSFSKTLMADDIWNIINYLKNLK